MHVFLIQVQTDLDAFHMSYHEPKYIETVYEEDKNRHEYKL